MSGICSQHRHHEPGCRLCGKTPADIFGTESWTRKLAEAEAAGKHKCGGCGFVFYLTVNACPLCTKKVSESDGLSG